jgi:DNA-binding response OmpR family regulator
VTAAARVLVVDDDPTVAEVVGAYLVQAGIEVHHAADGVSALAVAARTRPDLVVLDLMLPGLSGLEVCTRLRSARPDLAVVMLTALGEESDRVAGLETGADDYLVKPFSPRELVLRVQSVLRRAGAVTPASHLPRRLAGAAGAVAGDPGGDPAGCGAHGTVEVDVPGRSVRVAGRPVSLTTREFDLLVHLMAHPGRAFTRADLLRDVWGWEFGDTSTVTVHVRRLREKLEADPGEPWMLVTVWGVGYRWDGQQPPAPERPRQRPERAR